LKLYPQKHAIQFHRASTAPPPHQWLINNIYAPARNLQSQLPEPGKTRKGIDLLRARAIHLLTGSLYFISLTAISRCAQACPSDIKWRGA